MQKITSKLLCGILGFIFSACLKKFPKTIRVECTNSCNARCTICPHKNMTRKVEFMSDTLYEKIIRECAENSCRVLHLHNFGEPLLDKKLEQRIRYAKSNGIPRVKIFTNGSLLTEDRSRSLIEAGLDEIKVSFDGASRHEFEDIRTPLKYDDVVKNVRKLVKLRNELRSSMKIFVACCSTQDRSETMNLIASEVDGFSFGKIHNWAGEQEHNSPSRIRKPCERIWNTFTILANGDVALCCLDHDGQVILGHLDDKTSIRDIFTNAEYKRIRKLHSAALQESIPLCKNCTKSFL